MFKDVWSILSTHNLTKRSGSCKNEHIHRSYFLQNHFFLLCVVEAGGEPDESSLLLVSLTRWLHPQKGIQIKALVCRSAACPDHKRPNSRLCMEECQPLSIVIFSDSCYFYSKIHRSRWCEDASWSRFTFLDFFPLRMRTLGFRLLKVMSGINFNAM